MAAGCDDLGPVAPIINTEWQRDVYEDFRHEMGEASEARNNAITRLENTIEQWNATKNSCSPGATTTCPAVAYLEGQLQKVTEDLTALSEALNKAEPLLAQLDSATVKCYDLSCYKKSGYFGGKGSEPNQFDFGSGGTSTDFSGSIAVDDDGFIYVADVGNRWIQNFAP